MNQDALTSSHPILSCEEAANWEHTLLDTDEDAWSAMKRVGSALGRELRGDYGMTREKRSGIHVLGLIGKGHNGGDALLAIAELLAVAGFVDSLTLVVSCEEGNLKPNTKRALDELRSVRTFEIIELRDGDVGGWLTRVEQALTEKVFHICTDGLLGMQFRPPLREAEAGLIALVNGTPAIRFRAAVDLPSGVGDSSDEVTFRADFTYATGILKKPLLEAKSAGCIRYLDIGFFETSKPATERVITKAILDPIKRLRPAHSEKREFGHLAVVAGSRSMPGALCMSVHSALRSGVGLVTVFAPESVVAQLACVLPEAMWQPWPETPDGGLALEGLHLIRRAAEKANALLLGPGMGRDRETQALLCSIASEWEKPVVLDADALTPSVIESFCDVGNDGMIVTPHDGEFARLSGSTKISDETILRYARGKRLCLVKKGSSTRVSDGRNLYLNTSGNAALSRGGSGDMLAGLIAGLLAREPKNPLLAACMGVYWHGRAADKLAQERGQTALRTTDLLDFFSAALED